MGALRAFAVEHELPCEALSTDIAEEARLIDDNAKEILVIPCG